MELKNFDKFHNAGYKKDYIMEKLQMIYVKRKGLRYREDILDNIAGSEELQLTFFVLLKLNQN